METQALQKVEQYAFKKQNRYRKQNRQHLLFHLYRAPKKSAGTTPVPVDIKLCRQFDPRQAVSHDAFHFLLLYFQL